MKKILLLIILISAVSFANAQDEFKPFRIDFGVGYAAPIDKDALNGGLALSVEPKLTVFQHIGVGLRLEGALLAHLRENASSDVKANASYLVTGDWRFNFTHSSFRPFVGVGIGACTIGGTAVDDQGNYTDLDTKTNFAAMARAGFDFWHLSLAAEYNLAGKDRADISGNYFAIKATIFLWGGKK